MACVDRCSSVLSLKSGEPRNLLSTSATSSRLQAMSLICFLCAGEIVLDAVLLASFVIPFSLEKK